MEVFVTCITGEQTKETVFVVVVFFFAIQQSEFESEDARGFSGTGGLATEIMRGVIYT